MPDTTAVTQHTLTVGGHTTSYLASGPEDGPLIILVHGWPELSLSWRHQLPLLGALGFRAVAPDLRGYGGSTVYKRHEDYAMEPIVGDMLGLLDGLGRERAVWLGHDWGSPVVWSFANHHPDRCAAVANLCVPYATLECGWDAVLPLVDRDLYPEDKYPFGQWDYVRNYEEHFDAATAEMDANPYNMVKLLFRKGDPSGQGLPFITANIRAQGGWFAGTGQPFDLPMDPDVVTEEDLRVYAQSLGRNGFFGPNSFYMNHEKNEEYNAKPRRLEMPVLFFDARYDYVCQCVTNHLADPMRELCSDLTYVTLDCGHWMAQEKPREVNAALLRWLVERVPRAWPTVH